MEKGAEKLFNCHRISVRKNLTEQKHQMEPNDDKKNEIFQSSAKTS